MTNILVGPVPTVFTPPASCLQVTTSAIDPRYYSQSYSLFIGNFNARYTEGNYFDAATACYPSATTRIDFWGNYYYSPAYCPMGYTQACSYTAGDGIYNLASSVTASVCCPTGFGCVAGWAHGCQKMTSGVVSSVFVASAPTAQYESEAQLTTVSLDNNYYIWHDGVPVAWESTDTDILSQIVQASQRVNVAKTSGASSPTPTGSIAPSTAAPASASRPTGPASTSTSAPTPAPSSSGISTVAKIGIAVGVTIVAVLFLVAALLIIRRRVRTRRASVAPFQDTKDVHLHSVERYAMVGGPSELAVPPSELAGDGHTGVAYELPVGGDGNSNDNVGRYRDEKVESRDGKR